MAEVLYRKWRPQRLSELAGHEPIAQTLRRAVSTDRVAHAYLFAGPRGTGKTSTARILAKAINCNSPQDGEPDNSCDLCKAVEEGRALDLIEMDAASNRGIGDIRTMRDRINFAPNEAKYKVYIIDEVHMLTTEAFNALLKTLEEPPAHAILILATTEPHRVPLTIVSRCQRFDFRRIPIDKTIARLSEVSAAEGVSAEENALLTIARASGGSLRDAVNMLEQAIVSYGEQITDANVRDLLELGGEEEALELVGHVIHSRPSEAMGVIGRYTGSGSDLRQLHRASTAFFRGVLLAKTDNLANAGFAAGTAERLETLAGATTMGDLLQALRSFAAVDLARDASTPLPLELAVVESTMAPEAPPAQPARAPASRPAPQPAAPPGRRAAGPAPAYRQPAPARAAPPTRQPQPAGRAPGGAGAIHETPADGHSATLENGWNSLLHSLRRHKGKRYNLGALLRACSRREAAADHIRLTFNHRSHMERMQEELDDPPTRKVVLEALANLMGREYDVKLSVLGEDSANGASSAADKSHLVRAALNMGATIVEEREDSG